jgi:hypothetical protein
MLVILIFHFEVIKSKHASSLCSRCFSLDLEVDEKNAKDAKRMREILLKLSSMKS